MPRYRMLHRILACAQPSEWLSPVTEDGVGLLPACGRGLHIRKRTDRQWEPVRGHRTAGEFEADSRSALAR